MRERKRGVHHDLSPLVSPQARDGESVCVALAGQHGEGRYVVVNLNEGGKVCDILSLLHSHT